jgi:hypothetical protein
MVDGKNILVFANQFTSKSKGTQMVAFTIYDFEEKKKKRAVIPFAILLRIAFPYLEFQNIEELGDLSPQPASQPTGNHQ